MATTSVKSEIAGIVIKIEKQPGDNVAVGDIIVLLECMKMEIPVLAPVSGRVAKISVREGETIAEGQVLVVIST